MTIFIDGDFNTDTPCKYHCSPSCHPAQVGPEWVYGCTHKAWPQNKAGDFVPIVQCDGIQSKCEIPKTQSAMKCSLKLIDINIQLIISQNSITLKYFCI